MYTHTHTHTPIADTLYFINPITVNVLLLKQYLYLIIINIWIGWFSSRTYNYT